MMNSSMDALCEARIIWEEERLGLKDDDDVMEMIKSLRQRKCGEVDENYVIPMY